MSSQPGTPEERQAGIPEAAYGRLDDGSAAAAGDPAVSTWLEGSADHPRMLEEAARIWALSRIPGAPDAWSDLAARIQSTRLRRRSGMPQRTRRFRTIPASLAATLLIGLGTGAFLARAAREKATQWTNVTVPAGAMSRVELPGGVVVRLNSLSSLAYPTSVGAVQEVRLAGEGYFDIAHDPDRPFRVVTPMGTIHDVGTQFNVEARSGKVAVTVVEGVVALEAAGKKVEVGAGNSSFARDGGAPSPPEPANISVAVSWTQGRLMFHDEPLANVAEALSRRFGVPFRVSDDLKTVRLTVSMQAAASPDAARAVCAAVNAHCEALDGGWLISNDSTR